MKMIQKIELLDEEISSPFERELRVRYAEGKLDLEITKAAPSLLSGSSCHNFFD